MNFLSWKTWIGCKHESKDSATLASSLLHVSSWSGLEQG